MTHVSSPLMDKLREAADNLGKLDGYSHIHFIHIGDTEARLLAKASAIKISETSKGLEMEAWMIADRLLVPDNFEDIDKSLLLAETVWASQDPPILKGIISTDCLSESEKKSIEDGRMINRLRILFQPNPGSSAPTQSTATTASDEETDEHVVSQGRWIALLDLIGEFAYYAFYQNEYSNLTSQFPGLAVTVVEPETDWSRLGGTWFDYRWSWTLHHDRGLVRLSIGKGEEGVMWTGVASVHDLIAPGGHIQDFRLKDYATPFRALVERLEPSPYLYRFRPLGGGAEGQFATSYGNTPEEAYAALSGVIGVCPESIAKCFERVPANQDNRTWPKDGIQDLLKERDIPPVLTIEMEPLPRPDFLIPED